MKPAIVALAFLAAVFATPRAKADPSDEVRAVYRQFATAKNMRDLDKVGSLLLDSPNFLWISDGKAIWGRDAVLKRMALFQEARIWHVEPALDKSVAVAVSDNTAFLHLPLELTLAFSPVHPHPLRSLLTLFCLRTPHV